jgi:hypothetical protein
MNKHTVIHRLEITERSDEPCITESYEASCRFRFTGTCTLLKQIDRETGTSSLNLCPHPEIWEYQCLRNKISLLCEVNCDSCELSEYSFISRCWKPKFCPRVIPPHFLRMKQNQKKEDTIL